MTVRCAAAALMAALTLATAGASAADIESLIGESRAAIKGFADALRAELVAAIEAGGPEHAIGVCNMAAPGIASERSAAFRGRVGRTSLKRRNPANAPDFWELDVLEEFESRKAAGAAVGTLDHAEVVNEDGRSVFRYMKAIPTGAVCLHCHGTDIAPDTLAVIDELYPGDQARGFEAGDIRGAFTLRRVLD